MWQCITPSARKRIALVEVGGSEIKTLAIDHHGLIAATCKDLKIAERIDKVHLRR
jgi:hypothetical protein